METDVFGDIVINRGRERQIKEAVGLGPARQGQDVRVEFGEGTLVVVFPADVRVPAEEGRQTLRLRVGRLTSEREQTLGLNC